MADNMNDVITEQELITSLNAYAKSFGIPTSYEDMMAIASSIVTFQQKQRDIPQIVPANVETLIEKVVNGFNVDTLADSITDSATETLVQGVNNWQQTLKSQVLNTLNAYIQQFQPDQNLDLSKTVLSIIPLVENTQLLQSEANALIKNVRSQFNWESALTQVIGTEPLAIASKLSKLLQFGDVEDLVKGAIIGDHQFLDQPLDTITESLVNSKLAEILGSNAIHIDIDTQQMMIKQVTFKLNIGQSAPPPSKSNAEIAKQVDDAAKQFCESHPAHLEIGNLFQS